MTKSRRDLLGGRAKHSSSLLLEEHDLESLEVRRCLLRLGRCPLLCPRALGPRLDGACLLKVLLDRSRACSAGQVLDHERG